MRYSKVEFCKRIDVRWGNVSLVKAELELFALASKTQHSYYHLISGVDLPIHSQEYIHKFFEGKNTLFIGYSPKWDMRERVYCHNIFMANMRCSNKYVMILLQKMRKASNILQRLIGYKVHHSCVEFKAGCEWVSVPHDFVIALLEHKDEFLRIYKYSYCPDEIYKQTFAYNSKFRDRIYDMNDEFNGCLREIDWKRGGPYTWRKEDYDFLEKSEKLFARKFDEDVDNDIIEMVITKVRNENN